MLKYWRILVLVVMVLGAVFAIGLKTFPYGREGVEILYISPTSPAYGILEQGMTITKLNGEHITSTEEWNERAYSISGDVTLTVNGRDVPLTVNNTLGIDVMPIERTNLEFGLDLRGGTRILLAPTEAVSSQTLSEIISTLQTRANLFGLREMKFQSVETQDGSFIQVEAAGIGGDVVENLLSQQGKFRATVLKPVTLTGGHGTILLGSDSFDVSMIGNDSIRIGTIEAAINETFTLHDIDFKLIHSEGANLIFEVDVYTGEDVELVFTDPQRSGIVPQGNAFSFFFAVQISDTGAQRFADVTTGIPSIIDVQTGKEYLDSMIFLYLDEQLVSDLQIGAELGGRVVNTPQISGVRLSEGEAVEESLRLQAILRSGALPTGLETLSITIISPTLGSEFFSSAILAGLLAAVVVFIVVITRYRSFKIALPLILISFSEILIILGIAATNDGMIWGSVLVVNFLIITMAWWKKEEIDLIAWAGALFVPLLGLVSFTIDLPVIGGIIAAIGTGVDHQIIIADEAVAGPEREELSMRQKIRRAFFIIFGAAATTTAAMFPLLFIGVGLVRGFAITTIIGILVGILITRPAYAKIIEKIKG